MPTRHLVESLDRQLIRDLYPTLRRIAAVSCPVGVEPDDLVQDALLKVLRRGSLAELENPLAYLRKTIVNLARNERRWFSRRQKAVERMSIDEEWTPSYPADVAAILDLPSRQRAILYLVEVEGMPYSEAAAELGITASAARTMAMRARRSARLAIEVAHG